MYWEWHKGRPELRIAHPSDPVIRLRSKYNHDRNSLIEIPQKEHNESQKILGVFLTPTGDLSTHLKQYKSKADKFAVRLQSPKLKAKDIRTFHRAIYVPSMRYGLSAMTVHNPANLQSIQSRVIATMLQFLLLYAMDRCLWED